MQKFLFLVLFLPTLFLHQFLYAMIPTHNPDAVSANFNTLIERIVQAENYDDIDNVLRELIDNFSHDKDLVRDRMSIIIATTIASYPLSGSDIICLDSIARIEARLREIADNAHFDGERPFIRIETSTHTDNNNEKTIGKRTRNTIDGPRKQRKLATEAALICATQIASNLDDIALSANNNAMTRVSGLSRAHSHGSPGLGDDNVMHVANASAALINLAAPQ